MVLGCIPQAYKPCACPASRPKKEPRFSNRDVSGVMDGGAYTSEARSWSDTPPCAVDDGQDMAAVFTPKWKKRLPVIGELMSGGLIRYQGNQQRGTPLTAPLIRIITSWGRGRSVGRSVRCIRYR